MTTGIKIAEVGDVDDGEGIRIDKAATGTEDDIALFSAAGRYYALNDTCTHEKASLADGWVEDGAVECPLHVGKFCLRTGEVLSMPANESTVAHRVEVQGEDIILYPGETPSEETE
ncbi:non-heme iron oxygenase ferredoxin subunit [Klugiella xanthotipulae]|uniref:3-phenylpropionate/trans-cinnamate dioxygenase ferredoxin subunit n=1 Tax=Klugiella xanthotipulae TaxID=244735 RepID=A0A543I464_9MICO|nr:non-heme iron oxygenase ferredoxin subunit [Klugiella xanthotipulae]TQM65378.1 3-phenylpropionate/trans-cinnamate dioxygenase ferredoxin subunit [Klugiella xanthotipulae]